MNLPFVSRKRHQALLKDYLEAVEAIAETDRKLRVAKQDLERAGYEMDEAAKLLLQQNQMIKDEHDRIRFIQTNNEALASMNKVWEEQIDKMLMERRFGDAMFYSIEHFSQFFEGRYPSMVKMARRYMEERWPEATWRGL